MLDSNLDPHWSQHWSTTLHCKKNWSENKSLFRIPIPPTVFSISAVQNLCSSPVAFLKIIEVGNKNLTLLMETNSISLSKKYFRCIGLNRVGTVLSVSRIFSIPPPPAPGTKQSIKLYWVYTAGILNFLRSPRIDSKESIPPVYVALPFKSPGIDSQPGEIDSSESNPGLHKRLQILFLLGSVPP